MADTTKEAKTEPKAAAEAKAEPKAEPKPQQVPSTETFGELDPRIDNRTGDQRPPLETWPAVPQQVDGPDLEHQKEFEETVAKNRAKKAKDDVDRKVTRSEGPHGLGYDAGPSTKEDTSATGDPAAGSYDFSSARHR